MTTALLVGFLAAHGLLHLGIWLPQPSTDPAKPPPFEPDHSAVLTAVHVPTATSHGIAVGLAWATTLAYLLGAFAVAASSGSAAPALVGAASLGLALKAMFFHPWLSLGVLLDVLVLTTALSGWPVTLP